MEEEDSDSNNYYLWFPWEKNKATICPLLSWEYLVSSLLKHKTIQYMATQNGPGQSFKAFL